ncbi:MAG: hypothetical protein H0V01_03950 [Bacteroidetes bacterium]|nr:hypothetical protein [Bacteroidota bacterium]HET6243538.1 hypothetical protein [Bacteroidia bacterium]
MLKSLLTYSENFVKSFASANTRNLLLNEIGRYYQNSLSDKTVSSQEKEEAVVKAVNWLLESQENMKDAGFGSYHLVKEYSSSYPETSGYIIPSLMEYALLQKNEQIIKKVLLTADWLISIQKKSGGWQGMRIEDNRPETVFNTAQVIRGLITAYEYTKKDAYLSSIVKSCDWLCSVQSEKGYWEKFAFMNVPRVYDSYVDFPLLMASKICANEKYKQCAINNLYWIIEKMQLPNGWFLNCDNTIKHNDKPILHTISYTIDGLLDSGLFLRDENLIKAARIPADELLAIFEKKGYLNGRFNKNWDGSEYMICTGSAQISIVWLKLFKAFKDERYLKAAQKMNNLLVGIQNRQVKESSATYGAIPGSFPLWGKYEPFAFPNWATKYFIDALMLEADVQAKEILLK